MYVRTGCFIISAQLSWAWTSLFATSSFTLSRQQWRQRSVPSECSRIVSYVTASFSNISFPKVYFRKTKKKPSHYVIRSLLLGAAMLALFEVLSYKGWVDLRDVIVAKVSELKVYRIKMSAHRNVCNIGNLKPVIDFSWTPIQSAVRCCIFGV